MTERNDEIKRDVVESFLVSIFSPGEYLDRLLIVWGSILPVSNDSIGSLEYLISTIVDADIDVVIRTNSIQFFKDHHALNIPKNILSHTTKRYLQLFESQMWGEFFNLNLRTSITEKELSRFKFNSLVEKSLDRMNLIKNILFRFLMVSFIKDVYLDCLQIALGALTRVLFKRTKRFDLDIYRLLSIIRDPEFLELLKKIDLLWREKKEMNSSDNTEHHRD